MPTLGCIADDFTGGTDLCNALVRGGFRTVQTLGVPEGNADSWDDADALVVALKSRNLPAADARALSLEALRALQARGCQRFYFKYCSTFDSTAAGNIGPVTDALLDALGEDLTVACPAFPANGRTVYLGHLFVGDRPLHESGMQHHPLTPMTDANLLRVLGAQTPSALGLVRWPTVDAGPDAVRRELQSLRTQGVRIALTDALCDRDLIILGEAVADLKLVTGGSGLALGLRPSVAHPHAAFTTPPGLRAVLVGSCSEMTRAQVAHAAEVCPCRALEILDLHADFDGAIGRAWTWLRAQLDAGQTPLIHSGGTPVAVRAAQDKLGVAGAGTLVERALGVLATRLREGGVRQMVVAGGETSGAVLQALGVRALRIGPEIAPGVPWTLSLGETPPIALALKSGNFGAVDFLTRAWDHLP